MLVYEELCSPEVFDKLQAKQVMELIHKTASIIHDFIHKYHEKTEENIIFPIIIERSS